MNITQEDHREVFLKFACSTMRRPLSVHSLDQPYQPDHCDQIQDQLLTLGRPGGVDTTPLAFFPCNFFDDSNRKIASAYLLLGMGDTF